MCAVFGVGNLSREESPRRRSGLGKRAGLFLIFLKEFQILTTGLFHFPAPQPIWKEFLQPNRFKQAGFPALKTVHSRL